MTLYFIHNENFTTFKGISQFSYQVKNPQMRVKKIKKQLQNSHSTLTNYTFKLCFYTI